MEEMKEIRVTVRGKKAKNGSYYTARYFKIGEKKYVNVYFTREYRENGGVEPTEDFIMCLSPRQFTLIHDTETDYYKMYVKSITEIKPVTVEYVPDDALPF